MVTKRVQPMSIGRGDQWLAKTRRHLFRATIWIQEAFVKMANFNRVEAIDFFQQARPD